MALKTNKSFSKRLKLTRRGKIMARRPGQNHFNAKESQVGRQARRRSQQIHFAPKVRQRYINTVSR